MKMEIENTEKTTTVVIENPLPRAFGLPRIPDAFIAEDKKKKEKRFDALLENEEDGVRLLPGENTVSKQYWDYCKNNPCVDIALHRGELKKVRDGVAIPLEMDWGSKTPARLRDFLKGIDEIEKINKIKATLGNRKEHLKVIDDRIDAILAED